MEIARSQLFILLSIFGHQYIANQTATRLTERILSLELILNRSQPNHMQPQYTSYEYSQMQEAKHNLYEEATCK